MELNHLHASIRGKFHSFHNSVSTKVYTMLSRRLTSCVRQPMIPDFDMVEQNQPTQLFYGPVPKVGDLIYGMETNLKPWLHAEVTERKTNAETSEIEFTVMYKSRNTKRKLETHQPLMKEIELNLSLREMAHGFIAWPLIFLVETRVIAEFICNNNSNLSESSRNFYVGIVAEVPKSANCNRYLIFFDNGNAQYVRPDRVHVVCQFAEDVWKDVPPIYHDFIKEYLAKYPGWPRLRFKEGSLVTVESEGKPFTARVMEVDCAVAKIMFENDGKIEWIFRGSSRLRPMPKSELALEISESHELLEYEGLIKNVGLPWNVPGPKTYKRHECGPHCVIPFVPTPELNKFSPLATPLFFGWDRVIGTSKPRQKDVSVTYLAPCGKKLVQYIDVINYLEVTASNMSVDLFCFENNVNVLDEFVPARVLLEVDDISQGKEARAIQLVNSIDRDTLSEFEYISDTIISPGVAAVPVNTVNQRGCGCTDNCNRKCSCWKLLTNSKSTSYSNGRLERFIPEGLYECGSKCSCNETCGNRVVQGGVKWSLQVFKTAKKGWALRALHDLPTGTFLCTYAAGEIITDEMSEERNDSVYFATFERKRIDTEPTTSKKCLVQHRDEDCHLIDAKMKGNVGRFFNHSCDPNVQLQKVFINSKESRFPMLAFFTVCVVKAGSELFFDYQYNTGNGFRCNCEMPHCRWK